MGNGEIRDRTGDANGVEFLDAWLAFFELMRKGILVVGVWWVQRREVVHLWCSSMKC